jgi:hypothetical protein
MEIPKTTIHEASLMKPSTIMDLIKYSSIMENGMIRIAVATPV